jgi:hypothetical protein
MNFEKWLDTLVEEKDLDLEHVFEIDGPSGHNYIPLGCVIDEIKATTREEQKQIKHVLVKIDFVNGDVMRFFSHLAQALAI